jgi:hypothetical protein
MDSRTFERFAGFCSILAGLAGLLYSSFFVASLRASQNAVGPAAFFLMATGLLSFPVITAVYERLRRTESGFALLALILGVLGALGSFLHGAYDLAVLLGPRVRITPPANAVDPRGVLTFAANGLSVLLVALLITKGAAFSRGLSRLGYLLAALLLIIYLGRLILFDPNQPVLMTSALLAGFLVSPAWYVWLGLELRKGAQTSEGSPPAT